jgi:nicotinamide-nucleotide amidase
MNKKNTTPAKNYSDQVGQLLIKREETIAVAESVTAGDLQTALSLGKNAMDFFQGGITAYNLGQKTRHLRVDPIHGVACNCVSAKVAQTMAINVAQIFGSDWGIGITGYASPVPEEGIDDLFACFAIAFGDKIVLSKKITAKKDEPAAVRLHYINLVLQALIKTLKTRA